MRSAGITGSRQVLIIEDDTLVGLGLKSHLEKLGHRVVGQASRADEAIELFQRHRPDLILVDIRLDGADGIDLAARLISERAVPAIIITAYGEPELIQRACDVGVFGYLIKPATREALAAQIAVAVRRFGEQERLRSEKEDLAQTLETRKLMDKAKGVLMKRMGLDEPAAHRWLQLESQKRRIPLGTMAKQILEANPMR